MDPAQPEKVPDPSELPTIAAESLDETLPLSKKHTGLEMGEDFGAYRLTRQLGRGGFGEVWEAEGLTTKRRVALKVLTQTRGPSLDLLERFKREGRLAASVNHPRCVYIFGAEEIDGYPVISMELMAGGTLQDRLDKMGALPSRAAVDLILDVIEGLEASYQAGILHRDIKPSNCFVDETGRCKIGDFGISKSLEIPTDLTLTGGFVGTPSFASPEQIRGQELDLRSDIYSVGATLYALVTGKAPFQGGGAAAVLAKIVTEEPVPFSSCPINVPKGLERIILRAMSKNKEKRFSNYNALRAALLPFCSNGLTAGRVVARAVAYFVDNLLVSLVSYVPLLGFGIETSATAPIVALFAYFAVTEKLWGRSLGKYLLNLRVTSAAGTPLTYSQTFARTGLWCLLMLGSFGLRQLLLASAFRDIAVLLLSVAPFVTMRSRNGYAALHEILSGTRVMALKKRETLTVPSLESPEVAPELLQGERRGPYPVVETLWQTESGALLSGYDELLNRHVWIFDHSAETSQPIETLTAVRLTRLRWLQGSRDGARHWDAYEAPRGIGFCEWVDREKWLSWAEMRAILVGVAIEVNALLKDGYAGTRLSPTNIWVDSRGTAKLLPFPAPRSDGQESDVTTFGLNQWPSFLHETTYFGLTGNSRPDGVPAKARPQVHLPDYARPLLKHICDSTETQSPQKTDPTLLSLIEGLQRTADLPARLSGLRRAGPALVTVGPWLFMSGLGFLVLSMVPVLSARSPWIQDVFVISQYRTEFRRAADGEPGAEIRAEAIRKLMANTYAQSESTDAGRQRLAAFPPDVIPELRKAAQRYPHLSEADVADARRVVSAMASVDVSPGRFSRIVLGVMPLVGFVSGACAILMAAILGVGPLFRIFGMSLQTGNGETPGRLRCMLRAGIAWTPFLIAGSVDLFSRNLQAMPVSTLMTVIALLGLLFNLANSERGIPDMIADTYVVCR